jgi:hypothetical protein
MPPRLALAFAAMAALLRPSLAQDATTPQAVVSLKANFTPDPFLLDVVAGGTVPADGLGGSDCAGSVTARPTLRLDYHAAGLPLFVSATSPSAVTLLVNLPDGRWACSERFRGMEPGIVFRNPRSGPYDIWVGQADHGRGAPAQLRISEIPPR